MSDLHEVSGLHKLSGRDLGDYGYSRACDVAFDAVRALWRHRQSEGMTHADLGRILDRDPASIEKALEAPGQWTMRQFGELVAAMDGDIEIAVRPNLEPSNAGVDNRRMEREARDDAEAVRRDNIKRINRGLRPIPYGLR